MSFMIERARYWLRRLRCRMGWHELKIERVGLEYRQMEIICRNCYRCLLPLSIVAWVEVQTVGTVVRAFTQTFTSPEDVPARSRSLVLCAIR